MDAQNTIDTIKEIILKNYNNIEFAFNAICEKLEIHDELAIQNHLREYENLREQLNETLLAGNFSQASFITSQMSQHFAIIADLQMQIDTKNGVITDRSPKIQEVDTNINSEEPSTIINEEELIMP